MNTLDLERSVIDTKVRKYRQTKNVEDTGFSSLL